MIGRLSGTLLIEIWQDVTLQTSSRWRAGNHQRFWRVCLHPRFPGGSCRSCSLAQRHLTQRGRRKRYILKSTVKLHYVCVCVCVCVCFSGACVCQDTCGTGIHHSGPWQLVLKVKHCLAHLCRCSILGFVAFIENNLWGEKVKGKQRTHGVLICVRKCVRWVVCSDQKDTTPSKSGLHQSRICLILVRCCPPAWLSPISAE